MPTKMADVLKGLPSEMMDILGNPRTEEKFDFAFDELLERRRLALEEYGAAARHLQDVSRRTVSSRKRGGHRPSSQLKAAQKRESVARAERDAEEEHYVTITKAIITVIVQDAALAVQADPELRTRLCGHILDLYPRYERLLDFHSRRRVGEAEIRRRDDHLSYFTPNIGPARLYFALARAHTECGKRIPKIVKEICTTTHGDDAEYVRQAEELFPDWKWQPPPQPGTQRPGPHFGDIFLYKDGEQWMCFGTRMKFKRAGDKKCLDVLVTRPDEWVTIRDISGEAHLNVTTTETSMSHLRDRFTDALKLRPRYIDIPRTEVKRMVFECVLMQKGTDIDATYCLKVERLPKGRFQLIDA